MPSKLFDLARVQVASAPGTGTITLGSAVFGFLTFPTAGVTNGNQVTYAISDGQQSEVGHGTYTTVSNTLSRDTVLSSTNGGLNGSKISASANAQVFITIAAEDVGGLGNMVVGTTTISGGTPNGLFYDNAGTLGNLATLNGGVLVTSGAGVPSISTTLPASLTIPTATITGSTINGNTVTTGTGTLTLNTKTLTISNSLTLAGTDGSTLSFGTGGTLTYTSNNLGVFAATTSAQLASVISDETGTGALVFGTSPTLATPTLGAATATSINGNTLTTGTYTLTGAAGKTLTFSNSLTLAGTDGTTQTFPSTSGTVVTSVSVNVVTNAILAQAGAFTFKGNATSGTANVTDFTVGSLVQKASPVAGDTIIIADSAASGALKFATVGSIATAGSVTSIAGNTGAFTLTKGITNSTNAIGLSLTNATSQQSALSSPTGTASTSAVFMGQGANCTINPVYSGRIKVEFIGILNAAGGAAATSTVRFGTGTAPTNGTAVGATGTQVGNTISIAGSGSTTVATPFVNGGIITGLTPGTAYWFDLTLSSSSGAQTQSVSAPSFNCFEF